MTKIMTPASQEWEQRRKEIYREWKKMQKRGWSRRAAIPALAGDYGMSISTVTRMIMKSEQLDGIKPVRSAARDELHREVWDQFVKMRRKGYSWFGACAELGSKYGKHFQTISNWMREIKNIEHSNI